MAEETSVKMLKKDHKKVEELFNQFRQINPSDTEERKDLIEKITNELEIHAQLEEQMFYPLVEDISEEGRTLIAQSRNEHDEMKGIINKLKAMDAMNQIDDSRLSELETIVMNHVSREEGQVFPFAQQQASDKLGMGFAAKMLALKEKMRAVRMKEKIF